MPAFAGITATGEVPVSVLGLIRAAAAALLLLAAGSCASESEDVDWPVHGGTPSEQRYSPLAQINADNVGRLGLAWSYEFDTNRGQEATPIVVDGTMYVTSAWSKVYALDARTGALKWSFDPKVPGEKAVHACCDVVNRGVAVDGGRVFVGTLDARLIALDAASGRPVWSVRTAPYDQAYTITGAPRVVKGKVIIGNGGAELGVRGFVTAYDAGTGAKVWRFYTVPGDPAKGPDGEASDEALARLAVPTWSGEWYKYGGGGTVWDSIVYDAELDQLYLGVGNGSPWNHRVRSAGKGDNLFLSGIVAVNPDTGRYLWHYQQTPGETWDYTATQPMILADLTIGGRPRKALMQAPKNGFFYVIDRKDGTLISAENYVPVNWASGIDPKTGRPVETPFARYERGPTTIYPSGLGGHTWHSMAFHPGTGLVYIPVIYSHLTFADLPDFKFEPGRWNTASFFGGPPKTGDLGIAPDDSVPEESGGLLAWDPVAQKARWMLPYPTIYNGGVLATAGNLLFEGTITAEFNAYRADTGTRLWSFAAPSGIVAAPVTYTVDGEQYVAILAGAGGAAPISGRRVPIDYVMPNGRLLVFKLGGTAKLPAIERIPLPPPSPSNEAFSPAQVAQGAAAYGARCAVCHGGYILPDLRRSATIGDAAAFRSIVLGGALAERGMASFRDYLTEEQVEAIRAWANGEAKKLAAELAADAAR
jgi:PQQ-dependent dehydrogenase (methanol/ethanol family)